MQQNRFVVFGVLLALTFGFVAGTRYDEIYRAVAPVFGVKVVQGTLSTKKLNDLYATLARYYDGNVSLDAAQDGALKGIVTAAGDPYTQYFTAQEATAFTDELNGEIGAGIGAEIAVRLDQPTIVRVLADHPARAAGVQAGDIIYKVNGELMRHKTATDAASKIRGPEGTTVKLTVIRGGAEKTFSITRAVIKNPSVRSEVRAGGIGYMVISRFDENTGQLARQEAQKLMAQRVKGIVVDLRGNGGGTLDTAVAVASLWLKHEVVVTEKSGGKQTEKLFSEHDAILAGIKTIVLVDESSASASEILAAALHDHKAATLVGTKTFGKGSVQQLVNLGGGAMLKVTVARWYTPNGKNVTDTGIVPDKTVRITGEQINQGKDPQLDAAVSMLK